MEARNSDDHEIYVDFVPGAVVTSGKLGMTLAPGIKADTIHGAWRWERDLRTDMRKLKGLGTDVLFSVMEEHEYQDFEIPDLYEAEEIEGIEILRFAIRDMGIPEEAKAEDYGARIRQIVDLLRGGKIVVVHCRGGLGRTGTVAACVLVALGCSAREAVDVVRGTRKGTIQTDEQEEFVYRFERSFGGGGGRR